MRRGFTLIELIVVIIIIGILASIGITQYTRMVEKGRAAEARSVLGNLRSAEVAWNFEYGSPPPGVPYAALANLAVSGIPADCAQTTHYFQYSCDATSGTCMARRCTGATGKQPGAAAYDVTLSIAGGFTGL